MTSQEAASITARAMVAAVDGSKRDPGGPYAYDRTNDRLQRIKIELSQLIAWAEADAENAKENDARATARDDRRRARNLKRALALVEASER